MAVRPLTRRGRFAARNLGAVRAQHFQLPAPVGGLNSRDPLADMPPTDATILINMIPEESRVRLRKGFDSHVTGLGSAVESLMTYSFGATQKMKAAAGTAIYDVTSSGAVGAAEISSLTNARWQHTMFATASANVLYIVNGADAPRYYDGSSWTTPTITGSGLTEADLIHVFSFKRRLFFIEKDTLSFWYFPVTTISGSITEFNLSSEFNLGGVLMAGGVISHDAGDGPDDYCCFISSRGQVVVYRGTDPSTAADWLKVGTFRIGPPIGRRCVMPLGSDLVVITEDGFAPLRQFLAGGRASQRAALSDKIRGDVNDAISDYKGNFGWQPMFYPRGKYVLFNIPKVEGEEAVQYVANTTTGAWCKFTGQNANCWELLDEDLYFGGDGEVFKADSGFDDDGADITADVRTAFSFLGNKGALKTITMARPILQTTSELTIGIDVNMDYENLLPQQTPSFSVLEGVAWDEGVWDVSEWGEAEHLFQEWLAVAGVGYAAAVRFRTASQGADIKWNRTDLLWQPGGYI